MEGSFEMIFCDKCGNLMLPGKKENEVVNICRTCGNVSRSKKVTGTISEKLKIEEKKIVVLTEDDTLKQYPKTKEICPECGNNEAYWYMQQTRAADEPPTRFYTCTKCKHKWREY
jgi:DNA-directed RNA polymerase subunit M